MDKFTFNKIAGATLAALLTMAGINTLVEMTYPRGVKLDEHGNPPPELRIARSMPEPAQTASRRDAQQEQPIEQLLASANAEEGKKAAWKCAGCHSFEKDGKNMVGPPLYDIVGKPIARAAGFGYSQALKKYGGDWTFELLDCWLKSPQGCIPRNNMGFSGIPNEEERAAVIAYLRTLSRSPVPLPAQPPEK